MYLLLRFVFRFHFYSLSYIYYVYVCLETVVYEYPQTPEEGIGFPGAGVTGSSETRCVTAQK